ncbi:HD-GYP domain-containing protein [Butyrivibrio hungatei]|uniref:HD-GYP domain-containing protein n=1 Tax=Butyrivibrio hungatei TaxID=185008 RepID=UPI000409EF91|nr:HD domain-containing phosphohydrolase [Butyrivibrio hungatei]
MFEIIEKYQLDIMLGLSSTCMAFAFLLFFTQFLEKKRRLIIFTVESSAAILIFFDRLSYIYSGNTTMTGYIMVRLSNFLVFAMTPVVILGLNLYIVDLLRVEANQKTMLKRLRFVNIAAIVQIMFVVISHFTGWIYYIDERNIYNRGSLFLLCYIMPVLCPLIQLTVILEFQKAISRLARVSIVTCIFAPIIAGIIQIFAFGISIVDIFMVLVAIFLYVFSYIDVNRAVIRAHKIEIGELKDGEKRMKRLFDQTTSALVKAIENKDEYAQGHSQRVADIAKEIAMRSGMDEQKCEGVYYAALLHDIGMVGIPDSIIEKQKDLTEDEQKILKKKPIISGEILADIKEYPYLRDGVLYSNEKYDGSGYPEGLKGEEIPDVARIIAVADAYVSMTSNKRYREPLPYIMVRQEFVEMSGTQFDPVYSKIMLHIMDRENSCKKDDRVMDSEIVCRAYKEQVSLGVHITDVVKKIYFDCDQLELKEGEYSSPSIILFDSYDKRFHKSIKAINAYRYLEYGEIWPDGHYVSTAARNMKIEVVEIPEKKKKRRAVKKEKKKGQYEIGMAKYDDHITLEMKYMNHKVKAVISLQDNTKEAYIGITGENCHIKNIIVEETGKKIGEGDIERISDVIRYTDRIESDLPNIQIDRTRSAYTEGIELEDEVRLYFHSMSLPAANLVWHCPYIVLFYSSDGKVGGEDYREYAMIKINGEVSGDEDIAENKVFMKKNENFKGWEKWKEETKEGIDCFVLFERHGNKITTETENLGIAIENTTTFHGEYDEVYVALTGDEVAITDIRIMK